MLKFPSKLYAQLLLYEPPYQLYNSYCGIQLRSIRQFEKIMVVMEGISRKSSFFPTSSNTNCLPEFILFSELKPLDRLIISFRNNIYEFILKFFNGFSSQICRIVKLKRDIHVHVATIPRGFAAWRSSSILEISIFVAAYFMNVTFRL